MFKLPTTNTQQQQQEQHIQEYSGLKEGHTKWQQAGWQAVVGKPAERTF